MPGFDERAHRKSTFKEVLSPLSSRLTERSFADIVVSLDKVPQSTLRDGNPCILFSDQVISFLSEPFKFSLIGYITRNWDTTLNSSILDAFVHTRL